MIAHKNITKIVAVVMAVVTCLCLAAIACAELFAEVLGGPGVTMEYESRLFDTDEILSINIIMDDGEWNDMLSNAVSETYSQCDVEINGEMFYRVGIRPKGNTSLTSIAGDPETDRYSFKLEFDQYVEGQSCYGLDKLVLNNNYADATNMKEALIYDMYQYLNVDASLYNYARISVNGEYRGVYLALEAVEDSFLLRNYGTENGELYKPDSMDMGEKGSGFKGGGFGGFSMGGNGANLNYTDDELDSYSAIWDGEVTDSGKADHRRVITALKHISEGTSLERYMDVDNLLKYMAVHVFSVNEDSLSGMMAHNYYLYETDGRLNILPWDYNLALGGMGGMGGMNGNNSATSVVNDAIDNAFSGTNFFNTLMENEEYQSEYYSYLQQLTEEYIFGGGFEAFYSRVRSQIDSLVEIDPTAFYTYEEYLEAADTLYEVVQLRSESIKGQIEGTIPSTGEEQRNSDALVDASHLDLSVMGSMDMGDPMREWDGADENPFSDKERADWCVYDAQHFGTAQRRRRIFLVADFRGERAGEILFVPKSLSGYFAAGGTPRQGASAYAQSGAGTTGAGDVIPAVSMRIRCGCEGGGNSVREPNAQPAPATGLFKGFGVLPQQAEKQTSGGNAGCLFRAFVYTNALLAK